MIKKELKKKQQDLEQIENYISSIEIKKAALEIEMAKPEVYADAEKLEALNKDYAAFQAKEGALNAQWEKLVEEIESLEIELS